MERLNDFDFDLRNALYQIKVGEDGHKQPIWVKKLNHILNSDIHRKPLGCKINDTHIRIGDIHLESFYEARILFSHARWVAYFTNWLKQNICADIMKKHQLGVDTSNLILMGYETYMEHILFSLKRSLEKELVPKITQSVYYGIYEEPKFLQSTGDQISDVRIRHLKDNESLKGDSIHKTAFVICGISSTLSTFRKMDEELMNCINLTECPENYALIQVLPSNPPDPCLPNQWRFAQNDKVLEWDDATDEVAAIKAYEKKGSDQESIVSAKYLTAVYCDWHNADNCKLCYPGGANTYDPKKEKPIIETSETSMVPIQMIQQDDEESSSKEKKGIVSTNKEDAVDFYLLEKIGNNNPTIKYKYLDFLYSGHTERMDDHFKYYIRTGTLFQKILEDNKTDQIFDKYCQKIQKTLKQGSIDNAKIVDILVSTTDYSDNAFAIAINEKVFNNHAHMISLNPKKEFRSNFEAKYSNISYFLKQAKADTGFDDIQIRFHYIDDQIIVGDAFYRTKSLIRSLMTEKNGSFPPNVKLFETVMVLLSRNSRSSQRDYIDNVEKYFPLIKIQVPSIRSYADSCPICKLRSDAAKIARNSSLSYTEHYWEEKSKSYELKTLKEARDNHKKDKEKNPEMLNRQFRRFHCENVLWEALSDRSILPNNPSESEIGDRIIMTIKEFFKDKEIPTTYEYEYLIGFIEAMSKPFLYFKENNKKVALQFAVQMIETLCDENMIKTLFNKNKKNNKISFEFSFCTKTFTIDLSQNEVKKKYSVYSLLVILINCLAAMDSTYLLYVENLKKIINIVNVLDKEACSFAPIPGEKYKGLCPSLKKRDEDSKKTTDNIQHPAQFSVPVPYLYEVLFHAIKRIQYGISGNFKRRFFQCQLRSVMNPSNSDIAFWRALYLENIPEMPTEEETEYIIPKVGSATDPLGRYLEMANSIKTYVNEKAKQSKANCQIENLSFIYLDRQMNHSYILSDPINIVSEGYLEEKAGLLDDVKEYQRYNLQTVGFDMECNLQSFGFDTGSNSCCLITVHIEEKRCRAMFLCLSYNSADGSASVDKLEVMDYLIHPVLAFRHELQERFIPDLESNALRSALQAKAGGDLLLSNKSIGHGGQKDIIHVLNLINDVCRSFEGSANYSKPQFPKFEALISLFMDLCISTLNNRKLLNDYFNTKEENGGECFTNKIADPDISNNTAICRSLLQFYFDSITMEAGIDQLKKNLQKGAENKISIELNVNNEISDKVLDRMPLFIISSNYESENNSMLNAAICLIGIIDTSLRNAISHGGKNNSVSIDIALPDSDNAPLKLSIINDMDPTVKARQRHGITLRFFDELNQYFYSNRSQHDQPNGFLIKHYDTKDNHFVVELECYNNGVKNKYYDKTISKRRKTDK